VPWYVWVIIALAALAGEMYSTAFILAYVGVAAAVTALLAVAGVPLALQLVVFVPLTLALIALVRPKSLAMIGGHAPRRQLTGNARLVDRSGVVEQDVTDHGGMVRLGSGEFWSARSYPPGVVLAKGTFVRVMFVDGLTVYVSAPTGSGSLPELPPDWQAMPPGESA
jgi:membrane protein implicated in regulation of membrane protease activity